MISPQVPWPLYGGGSVRVFNVIKELSKKGHKIILAAGSKEKNIQSNNPLRQWCEEIHLYKLPSMGKLESLIRSVFSFKPYPLLQFQNKEFYETVYGLLRNEKFDLIWVNWLFMSSFLLNIPNIKIPVILDQHEADELVWKRYIKNGNFAQKIFSFINLKKIQLLQNKIFKKISALLCTSEKEAEFMKTKAPKNLKVWTVPNGVDLDFFTISRVNRE